MVVSFLIHLASFMIEFDTKDRNQVKVFRAWYYDPVTIDVKKYSAIAPDPEVRMEKSSSPAISFSPDTEEGLAGDNQINEREHFDVLDYAHDLTSHLALKEYQSNREKIIIDSIDIDSLLFAGEIKKSNEKEDYIRYPIKLKSDKALRDKAREIVEKSIVAMGGRDVLLKIKTMKTKVWIKAHEHVKRLRRKEIVINVDPYYYPVEIWENDKWMGSSSKPYNIKISLDIDDKIESYHIRDPLRSLGKYHSLFRDQLSFKRWHYIDRFLGEGVIVEFIQDEKMNDIEVSTILVDDRKHGDYFLAHFNKKSNLLFSTTQPTNSKAYPMIKTFYRRYVEIEDVLTPTQIERISFNMRISLFLQIAYNGSQSYEEVPQAR